MLDMNIPEPRLEPEEEFYIIAGCGHEVYDGEELYEWENGLTLCPDCMKERIEDMSIRELAALIGCRHAKIERYRCNEWAR